MGGTSCSSPIFTSVIALLNDELAQAGKPPLGFLNPFLYSTGASALNDITTGDNPGCGTNGFPATTGWDPVRFGRFLPFLSYFTDMICLLSLGHGSGYTELRRTQGCDRLIEHQVGRGITCIISGAWDIKPVLLVHV